MKLLIEEKLEILKSHEKDKEDTKGKLFFQSNFQRGYELMKNLHWIKLTQQQRCRSDGIYRTTRK